MENQQDATEHKKEGRYALKAFSAGALIVYLCALYYCYRTGHIMEAVVLGIAIVLLAGVVVVINKRMT